LRAEGNPRLSSPSAWARPTKLRARPKGPRPRPCASWSASRPRHSCRRTEFFSGLAAPIPERGPSPAAFAGWGRRQPGCPKDPYLLAAIPAYPPDQLANCKFSDGSTRSIPPPSRRRRFPVISKPPAQARRGARAPPRRWGCRGPVTNPVRRRRGGLELPSYEPSRPRVRQQCLCGHARGVSQSTAVSAGRARRPTAPPGMERDYDFLLGPRVGQGADRQ